MYSFDVFDTLITRTTAEPQGIFLLMKDQMGKEKERHGIEDYIIDNFFELRIHSEELARKSNSFHKKEEVTLYEIYRAMALCGCLDEEQIEYLCRLEQETEIANAVGLKKNINRVKSLLAQGERVVLISDMYMSEQIIRKMLVQVDPVFSDMPLYVSSEYCKRKTTRNLYRKVQEIEKVSYEDWTHIGDNIHQDMENPYWMGIKVEQALRMELSEFEKRMLNICREDEKIQLVIGTALQIEREYVEQRGGSEFKENEKWDAYHIGCRYAGPVLYSYAEWIVDQAIKKNITRLYFIARDGYLLKKIVDVILEVQRVDIQTKYIYGSRKAWRMPSLSEEHYNLYQLILWSHTFRVKILDELAEILHISLEELYQYLPGTYAKNKDDKSITDQEIEYIAQKLSSDEKFKNFHLQKLAAERELVLEYMRQEVDVEDSHFAFVDVAGGGLTQGCLRELLKSRYEKPIHTFFFKIDRVNLIENSITDTYVPSFFENSIVIEMLCRAPHGQTKMYKRKNGKMIPVLEETETQSLINHGFYDYEKGIIAFSKRMSERSGRSNRNIGSVRNTLMYVHHIAQEPSKDILEYFASMPSNESGREKETIEYAPRLTRHDIKEIFLKRTSEPVAFFYKGTNLNYSIMRATEEEKAFIEQCKREHGSIRGIMYRQETERKQKEQRSRYGKTAFYPIRLLEEKMIVYGAGKFGQELYIRLKEDKEHEVILWVDKMASAYQQKGIKEVQSVSEIRQFPDTQIIIAVMAEEVAQKIRKELMQMGVKEKRIMWIRPYNYPYPRGEWKWDRA